ncbi:hypothetical protein V8063_002706 [Vibrio parahaemolyticus]
MAIKKLNGLESGFCIVPNATANAKLSWAAKGLLLYLGSKPENWEVSIPDLIKQTEGTSKRSGRDAIKAILDELIKSGHVRKLQQRTSGKFAANDYEVCLTPFTENPSTAKPSTAEPEQQSKEITNTEINKERGRRGTFSQQDEKSTANLDPKILTVWSHIRTHVRDTYSGYELPREPNDRDISSIMWGIEVLDDLTDEEVCLSFCRFILDEFGTAEKIYNPLCRAMHAEQIPEHMWSELFYRWDEVC